MSVFLEFCWKFRAALLALFAVALIFSWRWDHNRLTDANTDLSLEVQVQTDRANSFGKANANLISKISDQNSRINELVQNGIDLQNELTGKTGQFASERAALLKRLAETPSLPDDCDGAVRETARSLKAITGGQ